MLHFWKFQQRSTAALRHTNAQGVSQPSSPCTPPPPARRRSRRNVLPAHASGRWAAVAARGGPITAAVPRERANTYTLHAHRATLSSIYS